MIRRPTSAIRWFQGEDEAAEEGVVPQDVDCPAGVVALDVEEEILQTRKGSQKRRARFPLTTGNTRIPVGMKFASDSTRRMAAPR